jgi:uncharacterized Tic20 family protein
MPLQDCLIAVIFTEAVVSLLFTAVILQPLREWLIERTPFKVRGEHLLECKICTSVWIGIISFILIKYTMSLTAIFIYGIVIHRCSNYIHLGFSIIRDFQQDIRVNRRKSYGRIWSK